MTRTFDGVEIVSKRVPCPKCFLDCGRHSIGTKKMKHTSGILKIRYSKHYCTRCRRHFSHPGVFKYGPTYGRSSWDFMFEAISLAKHMTLDRACLVLQEKTGNYLAPSTLFDWVVTQEELFKDCSLNLEKGEKGEKKNEC